jgi:hypothetical protein
MGTATARQVRRAVQVVARSTVREAMSDQATDLLRVRLILARGFWGRLRWLVSGR